MTDQQRTEQEYPEQQTDAAEEQPVMEQTHAVPEAPSSPGARLAAAREQRGWSVEQVAAYLKLAPRQVLALERDDHAALPGVPIVRGFVRSYAKLLKIDPAPLLAELGGDSARAESLAPREGLAEPFSEARLPSMSEKPAISSRWMLGVLLLVLVGAVLWAGGVTESIVARFMPAQQEPTPTITQEPVAVPQTGATETDREAEEPATDAAASGTDAAPATGGQPAEDVQPAATSDSTVSAPPADTPAAAAAAVRGANTLSVSAREESWIEIRRTGSGAVLTARLVQPGETVSVEVTEPVVLVVGNAAGVDASLRGKPLDLKGSTTTNVVRLNLK